ncbi:hypothetical protein [Photobacterium arenosum]|uniref:hypothetical protein n=1 Tax=Photobacterium arenosum TaxID=2774143 RepID=UPI002889D6C1|nr:hypothetical protein [Photobacterium arenosum]
MNNAKELNFDIRKPNQLIRMSALRKSGAPYNFSQNVQPGDSVTLRCDGFGVMVTVDDVSLGSNGELIGSIRGFETSLTQFSEFKGLRSGQLISFCEEHIFAITRS